ncbi:MAG: rRNA maturation RNase YbeY [Chitinophagaceae bacterium]
MQKISFHYLVVPFSFRHRKSVKEQIGKLFKSENKEFRSITYIFCSDVYLLEINKDFLKHDYYTDIITFNLAEEDEPIIGEIYISIDRVLDNSNLLHESFRRELLRVIYHGALHLCGYKDKTRKERVLMREREDLYLNKF